MNHCPGSSNPKIHATKRCMFANMQLKLVTNLHPFWWSDSCSSWEVAIHHPGFWAERHFHDCSCSNWINAVCSKTGMMHYNFSWWALICSSNWVQINEWFELHICKHARPCWMNLWIAWTRTVIHEDCWDFQLFLKSHICVKDCCYNCRWKFIRCVNAFFPSDASVCYSLSKMCGLLCWLSLTLIRNLFASKLSGASWLMFSVTLLIMATTNCPSMLIWFALC